MSSAGALRKSLYFILLLFSVQYGLTLYFNSAYLASNGFSAQAVGLLFAFANALSIVFLLVAPRLLRYFGNYGIFVLGTAAAGALLLILAASTSIFAIAFILPLIIGLSFALSLSIDMFFERTTGDENKTGLRRGLVVAIVNGGFMLAQFFAVYLLASGSFKFLYTISGLSLIGISALGAFLLRGYKEAHYERTNWMHIFGRLKDSLDMRLTFFVQFLLRLFYAVMVVYTPLYLHVVLGMPYETMGALFAFMLIPFLLLEVPVGRLEDTKWGEREVLIAGLLLTACITGALAFITTPSALVWAGALFATRVGAALLEISSEAYFFKHVDGRQSAEVSAFRILHPLAYIVGPVSGAVFLFFFPMQFIFLALALCMLCGIPAALRLRDTR